MRATIKIIFCLAIFFTCQTKGPYAQSVSNPGGTFPAPADIVLSGTAEVPMSLVKATEKYNNYYSTPYVEGWTDDKKIIVKEFGRTASLLTYPKPEGQPTSLLTFPQPTYDIYPSPDRKNYLYNQDTDGKLNYRMFVWNQANGQSAALTDRIESWIRFQRQRRFAPRFLQPENAKARTCFQTQSRCYYASQMVARFQASRL